MKNEIIVENVDRATIQGSGKWFGGFAIAALIVVLAGVWALWGEWMTLFTLAVLGTGGLCY